MGISELVNMRVSFTIAVGELIAKAVVLGKLPAINEAKRSDEQAIVNAYGELGRKSIATALRLSNFVDLATAIENNGAANGIRNSLHEQGLAVDLLLYDKDGSYLTKTEDYRVLGEWWEAAYPLAAWGGRFGDANHFSFRYAGKR